MCPYDGGLENTIRMPRPSPVTPHLATGHGKHGQPQPESWALERKAVALGERAVAIRVEFLQARGSVPPNAANWWPDGFPPREAGHALRRPTTTYEKGVRDVVRSRCRTCGRRCSGARRGCLVRRATVAQTQAPAAVRARVRAARRGERRPPRR